MRQGWKIITAIVIGGAVCKCCGSGVAVSRRLIFRPGTVIERIDVAGNVTLTRAEVLAAVRARPGRIFNDDNSRRKMPRRIAKLDAAESAYYNVQVENDRVILTYVVVERNLVRSITFKGNQKISDQSLLKELVCPARRLSGYLRRSRSHLIP